MIKNIINNIRNKCLDEQVRLKPFYRLYPYKGDLPIRSVDWRGVVDLDLNFFYNRIPKAANSTLTVNLAKLRYGKNIPSREAKNLFLRPSQLTSQQMAAFNNLFKFIIVRNPYSRTLSAYLDKIVRKKYHITKSLKTIRNISFPSFLDFCYYLEEGGLHDNPHWAPQTAILLMPPDHYDFIGKVEKLQEDMISIFNRLDPSRKVKKFRTDGPPKTHSSARLEEFYNNRCRDIVAKLYKEDFCFFDYAI